jgi:hypothetical protein
MLPQPEICRRDEPTRCAQLTTTLLPTYYSHWRIGYELVGLGLAMWDAPPLLSAGRSGRI